MTWQALEIGFCGARLDGSHFFGSWGFVWLFIFFVGFSGKLGDSLTNL